MRKGYREFDPVIPLVEYALPLNCAYMKKAHLAEMGFAISFEKDLALEVRHRRTITSTESACKGMKHFSNIIAFCILQWYRWGLFIGGIVMNTESDKRKNLVFCKYIFRNGKIYRPKHAKCFVFPAKD